MSLADRLDRIHQRIAAAGGDPERITVLAVTKGHPASAITDALGIGLVDIGENYSQELLAKAAKVDLNPARVHFIGGLQRNKIRRLAGTVALWQTIDRGRLIDELAARDPGAAILVQVNTTGEAAKSGAQPSEAAELVDQGRQAGLDVRGLMTVGPTDPGGDPSPGFAQAAGLAADLGLSVVSMGMSRDLEAAVAAGSTMVRIGTELFGPRPGRTDV